MSTASSAAALSPSSPTKTSRQVYQVSRSITERLPGSSSSSSKQPHTHTHTSHHHHNSLTHHISASLHRRERSRDGRVSGSAAAHTAVPAVLQQGQYVTPRGSLEVARSAGVLTPKSLSPYQSRRGSVLLAAGAGGDGAAITVPVLSKEEAMSREKQRTKAGTAGLKKSLHELATFSTTTNRRLDETYYILLQKITALQNTLAALRDLARASCTTNDGFITEAQSVLAGAQSQLDVFGDFSEQEERVRALQDRVHGGRERLAALSQRVDLVRHKVEKWEQADRDWQQRTRRRLKIVWGVVMGVVLVLAALMIWGSRIPGPAAVEELGQKPAGLLLEGGNGSVAFELEFHRGRRPSDDALRAFDEL